MASPVTPSDFQSLVPTATGSTCDKLLRVLFTFPTKFVEWYSYVYNEDGSFTDGFKADVCAIDCANLGTTTTTLAAPVLSQSGFSGTQITLDWNAVSGAAYYELVRNTVPDVTTATFIKATTLLNYVDTTVSTDTWYFYWVRARTAATIGPFSPSQITYATASPPLAIGTPSVAATNSIADFCSVTWAAIAGNVTYTVLRNTSNTTSGATTLGTTAERFYNDFNGTFGTSYYYFVRAANQYKVGSYSTGALGVRT